MHSAPSVPARLIPVVCLLVLALGAPPLRAQDAEPAEDEDRISFDVKMPAASGGGRVQGFAGDFEFKEDDFLLATGGVKLVYGDLQLQAETARLDIANQMLTAEGDVVLDEGQKRLIGQSLEYNLETRTGRVTDATAYVDTSFFFTGSEISKIDENVYRFDNGTFTSCSEDSPPWEIDAGRATVTLGKYAHLRNARMKLKGVPVLYVPRLVWPAQTNRASGFLVPHPGFSDRKGVELSLAYYKTLGRSADTTFFFDLSSKEFFGLGNEVRYRPSETTQGLFEAYFVTDQDVARIARIEGQVGDPEFDPLQLSAAELPLVDPDFNPNLLPDEERWKINWFHETTSVWGGFRGVINFEDYSDPTYRQDFERAADRQARNFIYSQAYLTKNFGNQSLNIMIDQREKVQITRFNENAAAPLAEGEPVPVPPLPPVPEGQVRRQGRITDTRRQLPEIEYRLRPTQLGGAPVYFSVDANLHYLSFENNQVSRKFVFQETDPETGEETMRERFEAEEYGRADLFPSFSFPLSGLPWFSAKIDLGGWVTHYTNSLVGGKDLAAAVEAAGEDGVPTLSEDQLGRFHDDDEALTRTVGVAGVELVGPSFSRIFDKKNPGRFSKIKHVIEPRILYSLRENLDDPDESGFDDTDEVPLFDEVDSRRIRNESTVGIINRLIAKPTDESEGGAFEILSLTVEQPVTFTGDALQRRTETVIIPADPNDPESMEETVTEIFERKEGPIRTILRFNPGPQTSLKAETRYNTLFNDFQSFSFSGGVKLGRHGFGGSLFTNRNLQNDMTTSNQLRVFTNLWLIPNQLSLDANLSFDLDIGPTAMISNPLQQRYIINYQSCCYSLQFELRESQFGDIVDRDFRFSFTLKNVGTFIDMNGSL